MGKITDLHVNYLSLVKRPATGKHVILRSKDAGTPRLFEVAKMDSALQRAYGIVYAPGQVDSQGDFADADVIRRASTNFMRSYNQQNVDVEHSFSSEMACVAETWLVRKGDPLFPEEPEGAWAVGIQIYDPDIWKRLESGELTGLSLAGMAEYEQPPIAQKSDEAPNWFTQFLTKAGLVPEKQEEPITAMKEEELKALIAAEIAKGVAAALVEAKKTETQKADACNGKCLKSDGTCPHGLAAKSADPVESKKEMDDLKKGMADLTELVKSMAQKGGGESGAPGAGVKKSFLD